MKNQKIQSGTAEPRILVQSTKCIKKSDPRSNLAKTFKFIHQIEAKNGTKNSTFFTEEYPAERGKHNKTLFTLPISKNESIKSNPISNLAKYSNLFTKKYKLKMD